MQQVEVEKETLSQESSKLSNYQTPTPHLDVPTLGNNNLTRNSSVTNQQLQKPQKQSVFTVVKKLSSTRTNILNTWKQDPNSLQQQCQIIPEKSKINNILDFVSLYKKSPLQNQAQIRRKPIQTQQQFLPTVRDIELLRHRSRYSKVNIQHQVSKIASYTNQNRQSMAIQGFSSISPKKNTNFQRTNALTLQESTINQSTIKKISSADPRYSFQLRANQQPIMRSINYGKSRLPKTSYQLKRDTQIQGLDFENTSFFFSPISQIKQTTKDFDDQNQPHRITYSRRLQQEQVQEPLTQKQSPKSQQNFWGADKRQHYLSMELVSLGDLMQSAIKNNELSPEQLVFVQQELPCVNQRRLRDETSAQRSAHSSAFSFQSRYLRNKQY